MTVWFTTPYARYTPVSMPGGDFEIYKAQLVQGNNPADGNLALFPPVFPD